MLKIAGGLTLPVEFAGRRTAVFGISGSGKSNTATILIEQLLHAGEQVVIIDPKGEGWGLLSLADGAPSNLPIIVFGEPNGHIETLAETHGPRLADFVVETGRSVVLSLLGFESDQSERRFVASFLRQLYRRKSRQGQPTRTLVVLEEAHLFVPESQGRGHKGEAAELTGAVQRIVRQGRTFGIGTLLVDQRPQDVSKRVVTQCDTLICHQLVHKLDRDALRDWVRGYDVDGRGEQFLESLASLEPGEAWIWSPAWLKLFKRIKVHRRKTFDSGAAPDGSAAARTVQRQEVDLDALRGQLAEIVDKAKTDDPRWLKEENAKLRAQVQKLAAPPAPAAPIPQGAKAMSSNTDQKLDTLAGQLGELIGVMKRGQTAAPGSNHAPAAVATKTAPALPADEEGLYQRFKARLLSEGLLGAGGTFTVTPPEKLRKDFQQAEAARIVAAAKELSPLPKLIQKFIEGVPGFTGQATIAKRIGRANNGDFGKAVKDLVSLGFAVNKDRVGVSTALRNTIAADLASYQPTEDEIEAVYQSVLYEIATEG